MRDVKTYTAGIDEVGRGALAGPVCAAAVVLNPDHPILGLDDSKKLTSKRREELAHEIQENALAWHIASVDNLEIDDVNILEATYNAMHSAINGLVDSFSDEVDLLLVDGNRFRDHRIEHHCIVGGDGIEPSIGAASIIAKVYRDQLMSQEMNTRFPTYQFDKHKGYGTALHRARIQEYGPCSIHRKTFLTKILA